MNDELFTLMPDALAVLFRVANFVSPSGRIISVWAGGRDEAWIVTGVSHWKAK